MLEDVFRDQWGRVLATLVGILGDIEFAEDSAQEAFALASERWPRDGEPDNPTAWLITTARNCGIDRIRRDRTLARKTEQLVRELRDLPEDTMDDTAKLPDERLELIFTRCHPALALEAQVGPDAAHPRRPVDRRRRRRVPRAVRDHEQAAEPRQAQDQRSGHPVRRTAGARAPERLDAVLAVIYLVFNQGWGAGRADLATEAIRLGQVLATLMPDESEVLARATGLRGSGPYVLHAAIADLHIRQPRDWEQIALLYGELGHRTGSPVVELNRAIAVGELAGPDAAFELLDGLALDDYRYFHSTRAAVLRRLGRDDEARLSPSTAPRERVHDLIASREAVERWWNARPNIGHDTTFQVFFGGDDPAAVMHVVEETPEQVVWRVVDGPADWIDTTITFTLQSRPDDGTTLLSTHADWREANEFMHGWSTNWGAYLTSLKLGAERGEFAAYPAGEMSRWS